MHLIAPLLDPSILFFLVGIAAGLVGSNLEIPKPISVQCAGGDTVVLRYGTENSLGIFFEKNGTRKREKSAGEIIY